ncbi:hypothetical protein BC829DRAFT_405812 [Chytridium lagenaria]|nr:hypothetical protein BC829DRAFT_405812 [Chytridium lagenaria]
MANNLMLTAADKRAISPVSTPLASVSVAISLTSLATTFASMLLNWNSVYINLNDTSVGDVKFTVFEGTQCLLGPKGKVCEPLYLDCAGANKDICQKFTNIKGLTLTSSVAAVIGSFSIGYIVYKIYQYKYYLAKGTPAKEPKPEDLITYIPMTTYDQRSFIKMNLFCTLCLFTFMIAAYFVGMDIKKDLSDLSSILGSLTEPGAPKFNVTVESGVGMPVALVSAILSAVAGLICAFVFRANLKAGESEDVPDNVELEAVKTSA